MEKGTAIAVAVMAGLGLLSALLLIYYTGQAPTEEVTLKIFCAGSLMLPMEDVAEAFENANPGVNVEVEGHGSIQVIRQVTELEREADLLFVADYSLIPVMMYNTIAPNSSDGFADWYIRFAGNSIVLAYTNQSKYASEANSTNWYEILGRPGVRFGFPNPMIDSLGYRSLMVIQLAENYYGNRQIFDKLVAAHFNPPISSENLDNGSSVITVPEVQTPVGDKVLLRASSVQLVPLLESGDIDYCFLYLSNARQYGFQYVELPDEINLGSYQDEALYQKVDVRFQHQRFASIGLNREGHTIYYGLTIPVNAPNPELAGRFAEFIISGDGWDIFNSMWHPIYKPAYSDNPAALPLNLSRTVEADFL